MAEIPQEAITAGAEAVNEAHAKRGWNKPAPWWTEEVATAVLEAAAPLLAEAWGAFECEPVRSENVATVKTEWGVRRPDLASGVFHAGSDEEAERLARLIAADQEQRGITGALVRRTVTYGPWEAVSRAAATREDEGS